MDLPLSQPLGVTVVGDQHDYVDSTITEPLPHNYSRLSQPRSSSLLRLLDRYPNLRHGRPPAHQTPQRLPPNGVVDAKLIKGKAVCIFGFPLTYVLHFEPTIRDLATSDAATPSPSSAQLTVSYS